MLHGAHPELCFRISHVGLGVNTGLLYCLNNDLQVLFVINFKVYVGCKTGCLQRLAHKDIT